MHGDRLNAYQKLRTRLLVRCLKVGADPEAALTAAQRMVAFVLGRRAAPGAAATPAPPAPVPHEDVGDTATPAATPAAKRMRWRRRRTGGGPGREVAHGRGVPSKRPASPQSPQEIQALAEAYLAEHGPTREPETLESVVRFMRSRDFVVVDRNNGTYELDSRHVLTAGQLVERANKVRRRMGKPCFPASVLESLRAAGD